MIKFDNSYEKLPSIFYSKVLPSSAVKPELIKFNEKLAKDLNIDVINFSEEEIAEFLSGKKILNGSSLIALNYAGHQFGYFNPQLGDGRAILIGELITSNNLRYDLHLKGSGVTPYSRNGDGRSYLGPSMREYILSEAMHALGVPTTRALSLTLTGEKVFRDKVYPGTSMIRVALGHIRIGTFEYFLYRQNFKEIQILINYCIKRFYPSLENHVNKNFELFKNIAKKQIELVSKWLGFGFIHGVMNTDNTSISGETIDYGPCAFMDNYSALKVFSSIDQNKRYAYFNQIDIIFWNLSSLANCFISVEKDPKRERGKFEEFFKDLEKYFETCYLRIFSNKLGIFNPVNEDLKLINNFLKKMENENLDFTNTFREIPKTINNFPELEFRLRQQNEKLEDSFSLMNKNNPFIIARNHLVENAIKSGLEGDYELFNDLVTSLSNPYEENISNQKYSVPPKIDEIVERTFCGT